MDPYVSLLIFILIVGVIGYLCYWAAGTLLPNPPGRVVQIVIAVLFAVVILLRVMQTFDIALGAP